METCEWKIETIESYKIAINKHNNVRIMNLTCGKAQLKQNNLRHKMENISEEDDAWFFKCDI